MPVARMQDVTPRTCAQDFSSSCAPAAAHRDWILASESHGWSPFRPKAKSRPKAMSMRLGAIFVAVCMTVIAASAGAVVFFGYGFSGADAIVVAIAAVTALALYNAVSTRMNIRAVIGPQLTELSRGTADLARQLAETGRRLAVVESRLERSLAKTETTVEPLAVEISELGALVDQLAETVATHETQLTELERATSEPARAEPVTAEPVKFDRTRPEFARTDFPRTDFPRLEPTKLEPAEPAPAPEGFKSEPARIEWFSPPPASAPAAAPMDALATLAAIAPPPAPPAPLQATAPPPPSASVVAMPVAALPAPTVPSAAVPTPAVPALTAPVASALALEAAKSEATKSASREMLAAIRSAIEANRIDLHLQPIVTLPQRKVRFYEAMSRLRTQGGDVVLAAEFISQAEAGGLMPKIDNLVVFRCVQVLRRLLLKNREVGVFCNLSVATLTDAVVFPQLLEFLDAHKPDILCLQETHIKGNEPIELESFDNKKFILLNSNNNNGHIGIRIIINTNIENCKFSCISNRNLLFNILI